MRNYHHITIRGEPLCQCEAHCAGLLFSGRSRVTYSHNGEDLALTCSYRNKARARSAWREVAKHHYWREVKVVKGQCPA